MSDTNTRGIRDMAEALPAARLGAELRATRQRLGWELPELAESLRIRRAYLEAIEEGRISDLPGTTYALGFVRAYASALGLPGEEVSRRFRTETNDGQRPPKLNFPAPVPQRGVPAGALMLLGLVILAGAYGGWYWVTEHQHTPTETVPPIPDRLMPPTQEKTAPSPQVASVLPSAAPPAPPVAASPAPRTMPVQAPPLQAPPLQAPTLQGPVPSAVTPSAAPVAPQPQTAAGPPPPPVGLESASATPPPAGTRIVVKASADAWVTIKSKTGPVVLNKLMHAGDSFPIPADKPGLSLTTGNAGGTEVDVDGAAVPGLGGNGMVRRDLPLDPDVLKSGKFPAAHIRGTHPAPVTPAG